MSMRTVGIDLAAEPKGTAISVIEWSRQTAKLADLRVGVTDELIVGSSGNATKIGIDCALGWPLEFIEFIQQQQVISGDLNIDGSIAFRRRLANRETDRVVREVTGRWPLSVSTDRLGMTAIRCSGLLSKLAFGGVEVDKTGDGIVVEIYPAASLRIWGFDIAGYRTSKMKRQSLLNELLNQAPWLSLNGFEDLLTESCDAFDSLVANLAARAAQLGHYVKPDASQRETAMREGWIALPNCSIGALLGK